MRRTKLGKESSKQGEELIQSPYIRHSRNWRCESIPEAQNSMARGRERVAGSKADERKWYSY